MEKKIFSRIGLDTERNIMQAKVAVLFFIILSIAFNLWHDCQALTFEQILALKKAGVNDQTIQVMIKQENNAKVSNEIGMGQKEIRDDQGNAVIVYSTGHSKKTGSSEESKDVDKAWEMLQHLIIDKRSGNKK
jgi:hypothetical protein